MSTLKAWRQVVSPHEDIRRGRFDASVFAADFGEVMAVRGDVGLRAAAPFVADGSVSAIIRSPLVLCVRGRAELTSAACVRRSGSDTLCVSIARKR